MEDYDPACPTEDENQFPELDLSQVPLPPSLPSQGSDHERSKSRQLSPPPPVLDREDDKRGKKKKKKKKKRQGGSRYPAEEDREDDNMEMEDVNDSDRGVSAAQQEQDAGSDEAPLLEPMPVIEPEDSSPPSQIKQEPPTLIPQPPPHLALSSSTSTTVSAQSLSPSSSTTSATKSTGKLLFKLAPDPNSGKARVSFQLKKSLKTAFQTSAEEDEEDVAEDEEKELEKAAAEEYVPTRFKVSKKYEMYRPNQGGAGLTVVFNSSSVGSGLSTGSQVSTQIADTNSDLLPLTNFSEQTVTEGEVVEATAKYTESAPPDVEKVSSERETKDKEEDQVKSRRKGDEDSYLRRSDRRGGNKESKEDDKAKDSRYRSSRQTGRGDEKDSSRHETSRSSYSSSSRRDRVEERNKRSTEERGKRSDDRSQGKVTASKVDDRQHLSRHRKDDEDVKAKNSSIVGRKHDEDRGDNRESRRRSSRHEQNDSQKSDTKKNSGRSRSSSSENKSRSRSPSPTGSSKSAELKENDDIDESTNVHSGKIHGDSPSNGKVREESNQEAAVDAKSSNKSDLSEKGDIKPETEKITTSVQKLVIRRSLDSNDFEVARNDLADNVPSKTDAQKDSISSRKQAETKDRKDSSSSESESENELQRSSQNRRQKDTFSRRARKYEEDDSDGERKSVQNQKKRNTTWRERRGYRYSQPTDTRVRGRQRSDSSEEESSYKTASSKESVAQRSAPKSSFSAEPLLPPEQVLVDVSALPGKSKWEMDDDEDAGNDVVVEKLSLEVGRQGEERLRERRYESLESSRWSGYPRTENIQRPGLRIRKVAESSSTEDDALHEGKSHKEKKKHKHKDKMEKKTKKKKKKQEPGSAEEGVESHKKPKPSRSEGSIEEKALSEDGVDSKGKQSSSKTQAEFDNTKIVNYLKEYSVKEELPKAKAEIDNVKLVNYLKEYSEKMVPDSSLKGNAASDVDKSMNKSAENGEDKLGYVETLDLAGDAKEGSNSQIQADISVTTNVQSEKDNTLETKTGSERPKESAHKSSELSNSSSDVVQEPEKKPSPKQVERNSNSPVTKSRSRSASADCGKRDKSSERSQKSRDENERPSSRTKDKGTPSSSNDRSERSGSKTSQRSREKRDRSRSPERTRRSYRNRSRSAERRDRSRSVERRRGSRRSRSRSPYWRNRDRRNRSVSPDRREQNRRGRSRSRSRDRGYGRRQYRSPGRDSFGRMRRDRDRRGRSRSHSSERGYDRRKHGGSEDREKAGSSKNRKKSKSPSDGEKKQSSKQERRKRSFSAEPSVTDDTENIPSIDLSSIPIPGEIPLPGEEIKESGKEKKQNGKESSQIESNADILQDEPMDISDDEHEADGRNSKLHAEEHSGEDQQATKSETVKQDILDNQKEKAIHNDNAQSGNVNPATLAAGKDRQIKFSIMGGSRKLKPVKLSGVLDDDQDGKKEKASPKLPTFEEEDTEESARNEKATVVVEKSDENVEKHRNYSVDVDEVEKEIPLHRTMAETDLVHAQKNTDDVENQDNDEDDSHHKDEGKRKMKIGGDVDDAQTSQLPPQRLKFKYIPLWEMEETEKKPVIEEFSKKPESSQGLALDYGSGSSDYEDEEGSPMKIKCSGQSKEKSPSKHRELEKLVPTSDSCQDMEKAKEVVLKEKEVAEKKEEKAPEQKRVIPEKTDRAQIEEEMVELKKDVAKKERKVEEKIKEMAQEEKKMVQNYGKISQTSASRIEDKQDGAVKLEEAPGKRHRSSEAEPSKDTNQKLLSTSHADEEAYSPSHPSLEDVEDSEDAAAASTTSSVSSTTVTAVTSKDVASVSKRESFSHFPVDQIAVKGTSAEIPVESSSVPIVSHEVTSTSSLSTPKATLTDATLPVTLLVLPSLPPASISSIPLPSGQQPSTSSSAPQMVQPPLPVQPPVASLQMPQSLATPQLTIPKPVIGPPLLGLQVPLPQPSLLTPSVSVPKPVPPPSSEQPPPLSSIPLPASLPQFASVPKPVPPPELGSGPKPVPPPQLEAPLSNTASLPFPASAQTSSSAVSSFPTSGSQLAWGAPAMSGDAKEMKPALPQGFQGAQGSQGISVLGLQEVAPLPPPGIVLSTSVETTPPVTQPTVSTGAPPVKFRISRFHQGPAATQSVPPPSVSIPTILPQVVTQASAWGAPAVVAAAQAPSPPPSLSTVTSQLSSAAAVPVQASQGDKVSSSSRRPKISSILSQPVIEDPHLREVLGNMTDVKVKAMPAEDTSSKPVDQAKKGSQQRPEADSSSDPVKSEAMAVETVLKNSHDQKHEEAASVGSKVSDELGIEPKKIMPESADSKTELRLPDIAILKASLIVPTNSHSLELREDNKPSVKTDPTPKLKEQKLSSQVPASEMILDMESIPLPGEIPLPLPSQPVKEKSGPSLPSASGMSAPPLPKESAPPLPPDSDKLSTPPLPSLPPPQQPPQPAATPDSSSSSVASTPSVSPKSQTLGSLLAERKKRFSQSPLAIGMLPKIQVTQSPLAAGPLPKLPPEPEMDPGSSTSSKKVANLGVADSKPKISLQLGSAPKQKLTQEKEESKSASSASKIHIVLKSKTVMPRMVAPGFDDEASESEESGEEETVQENSDFENSILSVFAEDKEETPPPPPPPQSLPLVPPVLTAAQESSENEDPLSAMKDISKNSKDQKKSKYVSLTDIEAFPVQVITSSRKEEDTPASSWPEFTVGKKRKDEEAERDGRRRRSSEREDRDKGRKKDGRSSRERDEDRDGRKRRSRYEEDGDRKDTSRRREESRRKDDDYDDELRRRVKKEKDDYLDDRRSGRKDDRYDDRHRSRQDREDSDRRRSRDNRDEDEGYGRRRGRNEDDEYSRRKSRDTNEDDEYDRRRSVGDKEDDRKRRKYDDDSRRGRQTDRDRSRDRSRERERSWERDRDDRGSRMGRSSGRRGRRSRDRSRSRSRTPTKRERERDHSRDRFEKSWDRDRSRSRSRERERDRSSSSHSRKKDSRSFKEELLEEFTKASSKTDVKDDLYKVAVIGSSSQVYVSGVSEYQVEPGYPGMADPCIYSTPHQGPEVTGGYPGQDSAYAGQYSQSFDHQQYGTSWQGQPAHDAYAQNMPATPSQGSAGSYPPLPPDLAAVPPHPYPIQPPHPYPQQGTYPTSQPQLDSYAPQPPMAPQHLPQVPHQLGGPQPPHIPVDQHGQPVAGHFTAHQPQVAQSFVHAGAPAHFQPHPFPDTQFPPHSSPIPRAPLLPHPHRGPLLKTPLIPRSTTDSPVFGSPRFPSPDIKSSPSMTVPPESKPPRKSRFAPVDEYAASCGSPVLKSPLPTSSSPSVGSPSSTSITRNEIHLRKSKENKPSNREEPSFETSALAEAEFDSLTQAEVRKSSRSSDSRKRAAISASDEVNEPTVSSSGVEDSTGDTGSDSGTDSSSQKPLKVKSRWRRNSEAEAVVDTSTPPQVPTPPPSLAKQDSTSSSLPDSAPKEMRLTRSRVAADESGTAAVPSTEGGPPPPPPRKRIKMELEAAGLAEKDEDNQPLKGDEAAEYKEDEAEDMASLIKRPDFPKFEIISENIHLTERKRSKSMKRMTCDCTISREDRAMGIPACGSDCLNRMLMIECGSRCLCGEYCTNRRFQRKQYSKTLPFKAGDKGWGLRADEDMEEKGTFIMEYVGELLDYEEFVRRTRQYSKAGLIHHYFMALNADEVVDATLKGNISRFINHSCDPNCETQKWTVNGELRVGFFTKKPIKNGEELTFDYQFEHYGEAQKCYCGSENCRGYIGLVKSPTRNNKRKEKKRKEIFKDELLEEDIEELSLLDGMRNKNHVLELCRLMVRAEKVQHRMAILKILQDTKETACLRLFLDYHGLPLFWSWMADIGTTDYSDETHDLKMLMLSVLKSLPITNRTVLKESKILDIVERWAVAAVAAARKPPPPPPPTSTSTTTGAPTTAENSSTAGVDNEADSASAATAAEMENETAEEVETAAVAGAEPEPSTSTSTSPPPASPSLLPPPPNSNITPVSILASAKDTKDAKRKRRVTFAEEPVESAFSPEPEDDMEESDDISSSTQYADTDQINEEGVDIPGEATASRGRETQLREGDVLKMKLNPEADSTSQKDNFDGGDNAGTSSDTDTSDTECFIKDPLASLAAECVSQWSSLKEVFKIPKKERVEERKRTERELDVLAKKEPETSDPYAKWKRHPVKLYRKRSLEDEEKKSSQPKMSKEERRQLFEAQVKAEDELAAQAAAEERQRQQEAYMLHQQRLLEDPQYFFYHQQQQGDTSFAGLDPSMIPPEGLIDPITGQPIPPEVMIDPQTGQPILDPNTGQPVIDPNTGQPIIDPNTGQPLLHHPQHIDPNTGQPLVPSHHIDPHTGHPVHQIDPHTGQPIMSQIDPATGQPIQHQIDPHTGQPIPSPIDPLTGQPIVQPIHSQIDPHTGQPIHSQIDPHTGQPIQHPGLVQPAPGFSHQPLDPLLPQPHISHQQPSQPSGQHLPAPAQNLGDLEFEEEVPPPPSPPTAPVSKLPPNWKTAKDAEGRIYYYHAFTRQTQWEIPSWDENDDDSDDMDLDPLPPEEIIKQSKKKTTTAAADTSSEVARKIKDQFRSKMSHFIVVYLNPYRKQDCKIGRIVSTEDFKHLARKLTHHVMTKELKHCRHVEDLEVNENVKAKAKDYVRKYMSKFGPVFKKSSSPQPDDSTT